MLFWGKLLEEHEGFQFCLEFRYSNLWVCRIVCNKFQIRVWQTWVQILILPCMWSWTNCLTSLSLSFLICKMDITPVSQGWCVVISDTKDMTPSPIIPNSMVSSCLHSLTVSHQQDEFMYLKHIKIVSCFITSWYHFPLLHCPAYTKHWNFPPSP